MDDMLQRIQAMERNSIRLHIAGPVPDTRSFTRFGGVPDVPAGFQWPVFETATYDDDAVKCRPLAFLAQFDCGELSPYDKDGLLPKTGLLSFFYELGSQRWGFDPADAGCARVFWFPDTAALSPSALPDNLPEPYRLPALGIDLAAEPSWPDGEDFFSLSGGQGDWDTFEEARAMAGGDLEVGERSYLLGWPDTMQGNITVECELVSRGIYMGGTEPIPQDALDKARRTSTQDWQMLFQLDTVQDGDFELMFGDCGRIYFYIRREDLLARRFDRVWLVLQCG